MNRVTRKALTRIAIELSGKKKRSKQSPRTGGSGSGFGNREKDDYVNIVQDLKPKKQREFLATLILEGGVHKSHLYKLIERLIDDSSSTSLRSALDDVVGKKKARNLIDDY